MGDRLLFVSPLTLVRIFTWVLFNFTASVPLPASHSLEINLFQGGIAFSCGKRTFFYALLVLEASLMDNGIFSRSCDSDLIEGADSLDQEPEPQKKPAQKNLTLDPKRRNDRPHKI